jgi:hypothetical protein
VAVHLRARPPTVHASGSFRFLDDRCAGAAVAFSYLSPDGSVTDVAKVARRPGNRESFEASFADRPSSQLLLRLRPRAGQASVDYCLLQIDSLAIRQEAGAQLPVSTGSLKPAQS